MELTLIASSEKELPEIAKKIIEACGNHSVLAFFGEMGAGKTTLIRAICSELGVLDVVSSPTFSVVNEYIALSQNTIYHFDFYRIKDENEAYDMGYEEYFYSGNLCLVEWPQKIEGLMPEDMIKVEITVESEIRTIKISQV